MKNLAYRTVRGGAWGKTSSRVIIAHGLLGNSANWATVARRMAEHDLLHSKLHEIKMIDMRNHGNSPHVSPHTNATMASDLEVFALQQQQEQETSLQCDDGGMVLIGHSMGGVALIAALLRRANEKALLLPSEEELHKRCARGDYYGWQDNEQGYAREMRVVNESMGFRSQQLINDILFINNASSATGLSSCEGPQRPSCLRVKAAIIVDITPTVRIGRQDDAPGGVASTLDAMVKADLSRMRSFSEGSKELERVGLRDKVLRDFVLTNLHLDNRTGMSKWRCNLSALHADCIHTRLGLREWFLQSPVDSGASNGNMVAPVRCALPTLFVFGEKSPFNTKEDRQKINRFFSNYKEVEVAGAGHFVHYEKMQDFVETVAPFIDEHLSTSMPNS